MVVRLLGDLLADGIVVGRGATVVVVGDAAADVGEGAGPCGLGWGAVFENVEAPVEVYGGVAVGLRYVPGRGDGRCLI